MIVQYILLLGSETKLLRDIGRELHNFNNVKVFYTDSCQQALDYISRFNCNLVIMDFNGLNFGIKFIKKLRTLHSGTLLVLSIHATEHEELQVLDAGADQYLEIEKPLSMKRCLAYVAAIIRRNSSYNYDKSANILNAKDDIKINQNLR